MSSAAHRKRTSARAWLTRAKNALMLELNDGDRPRDYVVIADLLEDFNKRLNKLDVLQEHFEMELHGDDFTDEVDLAADFREDAMIARFVALKVLEEGEADSRLEREERESRRRSSTSRASHGSHTGHVSSSNGRPDAKLPKLVLPTFSGDVLQWQSFWDQFEATINASALPTITKFTYLRSLLEGEALEVIQGLTLSEVHYAAACELLKQRFGRKERIIFTHIQDLLGISLLGHRTPGNAGLRKLQDTLFGHIRSLEALGISCDKYGVLLTPIVLSCLPSEIRMEWAVTVQARKRT